MDREEILELIESQKDVIREVVADEELRSLNAQLAKVTFDSFIKAGFNEEQAIILVAASFSKK